MGTFKLHAPARLIFSRILAWNARSPRLIAPQAANVYSRDRFETRRLDAQIVSEFRARIRQTEDLIGKLGYSLRELCEMNER